MHEKMKNTPFRSFFFLPRNACSFKESLADKFVFFIQRPCGSSQPMRKDVIYYIHIYWLGRIKMNSLKSLKEYKDVAFDKF